MSFDIAELIFIFATIVVIGAWLWRYKIRPFFARQAMHRLLKNISHGKDLEERVVLLRSLYQKTQGGVISQSDRAKLGFKEDAFVYGEIDFLSFILILDKVKPRPNEIFYDLGSGVGKAVLTAALCFDFNKTYGIELLPGLHQAANEILNRLSTYNSVQLSSISFINGNFLNYDFTDGDVIFINATCLDYYAWQAIVEKLIRLKPGSRVIVTTKKILNPEFKMLYEGRELMSWGMNSVHIYVKIS